MTKTNAFAHRMTFGQALIEMRCLCEGCRACRGAADYPCGALSEALCAAGGSNARCRWCE